MKKLHPYAQIKSAIFDINKELEKNLKKFAPKVVINTCGPFQNANYSVAQSCIKYKCNYIDLSDSRDFVNGINCLNASAKKAGILVITGASTVPALSSAVLDNFKNEFKTIDFMKYGISPGAKSPLGLATVQAILSYLGKPIKSYVGSKKKIYGWLDLYRQKYPVLGKRWMANCDIPDLDLLPKIYNIKSLQFSAGVESTIIHISMFALAWCIRLGLPLNLISSAQYLIKISNLFNFFGSCNGGMHIILKGRDYQNKNKEIKWFIIALNNHGPQIPCVPSIILTKKLLNGMLPLTGTIACVSLISLSEYMAELKGFDITQYQYD